MLRVRSSSSVGRRLRRVGLVLPVAALLCISLAPSRAQERKPGAKPRPAGGASWNPIYCCDMFPFPGGDDQQAIIYAGHVNLSCVPAPCRVRPYVPQPQAGGCAGTYPNPAFASEIAEATNPSITLSMNANFFSWAYPENIHELPCLNAIGLAVSEYKIISSPGEGINLQSGALPDSILFHDSGPAEIVRQPPSGYKPAADVRTAVSGILILDNGVDVSGGPHVEAAEVAWDIPQPRTAIGLNQAGNHLYFIAAVAGRAGDGVTLPELVKLFAGSGAYNVLNLDGAGSTSLNYFDADGDKQTMSPPDDRYPYPSQFFQYRPVPINLSFIANQPNAVRSLSLWGAAVPWDTTLSGETITSRGTYSFVNNSVLSLEATRSIELKPNSAVLTNKTGTSNNSPGYFRMKIKP